MNNVHTCIFRFNCLQVYNCAFIKIEGIYLLCMHILLSLWFLECIGPGLSKTTPLH